MKTVFADSFYWIALSNPRDDWHEPAKRVTRTLEPCRILTTDDMLTEFLTHFSSYGEFWRAKAAEVTRAVMKHPNIEVLPQSRGSFLSGLGLYEDRPGKRYSLTDCIGMHTMRERGLTEVLSHDRDYERDGFCILLKD